MGEERDLMTKVKAITIIVLFCIMTGSVYLVWPIVSKYVDTENHEKRELASRPELTAENISDFPEEYETYVNDNLPFRNQLIKTGKKVEKHTVELQSTDKVLVGKDGWLFYVNPMDGNPIADYQGSDCLTEEDLYACNMNIQEAVKNMEAEGRTFVFLIAPSKERIYSEYLPDSLGEPAEVYPAVQVIEYLKKNNPNIHIVYPYDALMQAKKDLGEDRLLYYKTDSHWNELGAYVAAREVMKEIDGEYPDDMPALTDENLVIEEKDAPTGDLTELLSAVGVVDDGKTYLPTLEDHQIDVELLNFNLMSIFHTRDGSKDKVLYVRHDSFGCNLAYSLAKQFKDSVFVHWTSGDAQDIRNVDPDVFVLECNERYLYPSMHYWYYPAAEPAQ